MDLSEDEVGSLFSEDRGTAVADATLSHWLTIERDGDVYVIKAEDQRWRLTEAEMAEMQNALDWDSPWRAISERTKCLRYLRQRNE